MTLLDFVSALVIGTVLAMLIAIPISRFVWNRQHAFNPALRADGEADETDFISLAPSATTETREERMVRRSKEHKPGFGDFLVWEVSVLNTGDPNDAYLRACALFELANPSSDITTVTSSRVANDRFIRYRFFYRG